MLTMGKCGLTRDGRAGRGGTGGGGGGGGGSGGKRACKAPAQPAALPSAVLTVLLARRAAPARNCLGAAATAALLLAGRLTALLLLTVQAHRGAVATAATMAVRYAPRTGSARSLGAACCTPVLLRQLWCANTIACTPVPQDKSPHLFAARHAGRRRRC